MLRTKKPKNCLVAEIFFKKITNFIFLLFSQEPNKDLIDIDSSLKPAKLPTKDFPTKTTTLITPKITPSHRINLGKYTISQEIYHPLNPNLSPIRQ